MRDCSLIMRIFLWWNVISALIAIALICFSVFFPCLHAIDEKDLHIPIDNDDWIVRFLRPCKFYPESARDLVIIIAFTLKSKIDSALINSPLSISADQKILQIQSEAFGYLREFDSLERDEYFQTKHSGCVPESWSTWPQNIAAGIGQ